ncbi:MAG: glycosyltransferase [candidate division Zixibacteria bacterium]|nr:glycosyltransferase [candidate division Zixibacteria bacterium]
MPVRKSKFKVAIVIPVKNDEKHINRLLDQVYLQDFPMDKIEIVVALGHSRDNSKTVVEKFKKRFGSLKILDNPSSLQASGYNLGIKNTTAPYLMTLDVRSYFPTKDIIRSMVETFESTASDCLCRPQPLAPPDSNEFQISTAYCRSSILGHRPGQEIVEGFEGPVDPMSSGAMYLRSVFEKVGYFDESFDGCEEVEFNYRLKLAGLKSYLTQKIRQAYYPPETFRKLWSQMYRYGKGRFRFARKHDEYSVMQWLAGFGVGAFFVLLVFSFFSTTMFDYFRQMVFVYLLVVIFFSGYLAVQRHYLGCLLYGLVIFPAIHFGLGLGFLRELLSHASKN